MIPGLASLQIFCLLLTVSRWLRSSSSHSLTKLCPKEESLGGRGWGWFSPCSALMEEIFSWTSQQTPHDNSSGKIGSHVHPYVKQSRGKENGIIIFGILTSNDSFTKVGSIFPEHITIGNLNIIGLVLATAKVRADR